MDLDPCPSPRLDHPSLALTSFHHSPSPDNGRTSDPQSSPPGSPSRPPAAPITINVGGRLFTTLPSTLDRSPFLARLLAPEWVPAASGLDRHLFVDANPVLFEHILNYLRRPFPPIFWSRADGFDLALYATLLREAEYFQLHALARWIREKSYAATVNVTLSVDAERMQGAAILPSTSHTGDVQKDFDDGVATSTSNSGKSTIYWKRFHIRRTTLVPPVRHGFPVRSPHSADSWLSRKVCGNDQTQFQPSLETVVRAQTKIQAYTEG